ncbi:hypothetical protein [Flaviaesturariibacter amylovorans]|uniref:Uncharacterized protein n=1 Tax=Flaviaesturariibacter amylovorans TaxID=1084520 RepID=A0ABP8H495_9BACT
MDNRPLTNHMGLPNEPGYSNPADLTPRREGGDDSLAEANPTDPRNDEKVLDKRAPSERIQGPGDAGANSAPDYSEDSDSSR